MFCKWFFSILAFSIIGSRRLWVAQRYCQEKWLRAACASTYEQREVLKAHSGIVQNLAFSPDGSVLASGGAGFPGNLVGHGPQDRASATGRGPNMSSASLAFLPNEPLLAHVSEGEVRLCDTMTGATRASQIATDAPVVIFALSSRGAIATVDNKGKLQLRNPPWSNPATTRAKADCSIPNALSPLEFSPDGRRLVLGGRNCLVKVWDVASGRLVRTFTGHTGCVNSVCFNGDGSQVASGGWDLRIFLWDVATGDAIGELKGHADAVHAVAFSPDDSLLASGGFDNTIRLWDLKRRADKPKVLVGHSVSVHCVRFSRDGKSLFSAAGDRSVKTWDIPTLRERFTFAHPAGALSALALSSDETILASIRSRGGIYLWHAPQTP